MPAVRLLTALNQTCWLSADAYYNIGSGTSVGGTAQDNMANTQLVVAKPSGEPDAQTLGFTIRQLW
jgi:hypothetical protein